MTYYYKALIIFFFSLVQWGQQSMIIAQTGDSHHDHDHIPILNKGDEYDKTYFINPVGHTIVLAGSFGELRTNHFHAGLDIKPKKYNTSEPIMVAADGYVSRIKIQRGGYGRALYVNHPNGHTTVYAHLKSFSDDIESYIRKTQYDLESFELDIYLSSTDIKVTQGSVIGQMGNTGRSYGSHLHFEIRETASEIPINPILFGIGPEDHKNPMINKLSVHALDPNKVVLDRFDFGTLTKSSGNYKLKNNTIKIPAWTVGLAVHSFDKMDGGSNTNGMYSLRMYVDDSLHYGFDFDKISFSETYLINGHIDYHTKIKQNSTLQHCYQLPGNTINIYKQKGDGTIKLFKDKARKIRIEVKDLANNLSTLEFDLLRDPDINEIIRPDYNFLLSYEKEDLLNFGNIEAIIPAHTVYRHQYIKCESDVENYTFSIGKNTIPLRKSFKVKVNNLPIDSLSNKRCIVYKAKDKWVSYGGNWDGQSLETSCRKLGDFKVIIDTTKPTIKSHKFDKKLTSKSSIQLKVSDNLATKGSAKDLDINVYIDGKWQLFQYKSMTDMVVIYLDNIAPGNHELLVSAEDDRGNKKEYSRKFTLIQ